MNSLDIPMWKLAAAAEAAAAKADEQAKAANIPVAGLIRSEREIIEVRKSKKRAAPASPKKGGTKMARPIRKKHGIV